MKKTILITGATDGIGLETARTLTDLGHHLLLHGRDAAKLDKTRNNLTSPNGTTALETYVADLMRPSDVHAMADQIARKHQRLDVLINNAGVYNTKEPVTGDGLDARFMVNTIAPYLLTKRLLPLLDDSGRVVNLSSAAQAPVDPQALLGRVKLSAGEAYAQSKLALNMWSRPAVFSLQGKGPMIVAVNPGSLLATKMVQQAFGIAGNDIRIGADILVRAALSDEFADASGKYFDNDSGQFAPSHPDGMNEEKIQAVVRTMETVLADIT